MNEDNIENPKSTRASYTCNDYRQEMILLAMQNKLNDPKLTLEEKSKLKKEITALEKKIGF